MYVDWDPFLETTNVLNITPRDSASMQDLVPLQRRLLPQRI